MATIIITIYIRLYHECFLLMANLESVSVVSVIKRQLMLGRPSTNLTTNFLVLLFFRAVTLGKSPISLSFLSWKMDIIMPKSQGCFVAQAGLRIQKRFGD